MFFSAHSIAFAAESGEFTASTEQTNDTTSSTSVPDKTDVTEETDSTGNSDAIANDGNETTESHNESITPATDNTESVVTPLTANAITGSCGAAENDHVTWTLEQNNEDNNNPTYTLTISGNGAIADYTTNAGNANATQPWKSYKNDITKIVIENDVSRIGNFAFNGLTSVSSLSIAKSVTEIGTWSIDVSDINEFQVESGNPSFKLIDGVLFSADGTTLIAYPCGKEEVAAYTVPDGTKTISNGAFIGCKIKELTFSDSVINVGTWMFGSNSTIEAVHFGTGIQSIGQGVFSGTASLKTVTFPEKVSDLSIGSQAFQGTGITELTLPSGVKEVGTQAFKNCKSLKTLNFLGSSAGLTMGAQTFQNNTSLKSVILPEGISGIATQGFATCPSLTEVSFRGSSNNLVIGGQAFSGCSGLSSITLPEGIKEIGGSAFSGLSNLTEVNFPQTVSAEGLQIDNAAFSNTGLTSLSLPMNVTSLGASCFNGCTQLSTIEWAAPAKNATINSYVFLGSNQVERLVIPEGVVKLDSQAIGQMSGLKYIKLPSTLSTLNQFSLHVLRSLEVLDMSAVTTCENFSKTSDSQQYQWLNASPKIIYLSNTDMEKAVANRKYNASIAVVNGGTFPKDTDFTTDHLATPTKANYKFLGWYKNADCTGTPATTLETNQTYYAGWEPKSASTISFNDNFVLNMTYNGSEYIVDTDNYTVTGDHRVVDFAYQVKNENGEWTDIPSAPVASGEYRVKAIVKENDTYASTETDWKEFSILKADPTYETPTGLTAVVGQVLKDVTLPNGFTWQDDADTTSVGNAGTNTFKVTYTPEDTDNYNAVEDIEITLTVYPKAELINAAPVITANDKTLIVGDAFDAKADVTAKDAEDGDLTQKIEVINNTVDTSKAGSYEVTYKVTDSQGASVTKTITVTVKAKDTLKPTPDRKNNPSGPSTDKNKNSKASQTTKTTSNHVKTGDTTNVTFWALLAFLSCGLFVLIIRTKKKNAIKK